MKKLSPKKQRELAVAFHKKIVSIGIALIMAAKSPRESKLIHLALATGMLRRDAQYRLVAVGVWKKTGPVGRIPKEKL